MLNIYCFKWGSKYNHLYVNRLLNALKKHCHTEFKFFCVTDNTESLDPEIEIVDYSIFHKSTIFTLEKLELMHRVTSENNLILDLDILIHNDITDLCVRPIEKPTFIYTHWTSKRQWEQISTKRPCFINSSFVRWSGDTGQFLWNHYQKNKDRLESEYDSCDKYIFYEHFIQSRMSIDFWEEGRFYNYNERGPKQYQYDESATCCLFNTSHLIKMDRKYYELEDTPDWAMDIWESYDES